MHFKSCILHPYSYSGNLVYLPFNYIFWILSFGFEIFYSPRARSSISLVIGLDGDFLLIIHNPYFLAAWQVIFGHPDHGSTNPIYDTTHSLQKNVLIRAWPIGQNPSLIVYRYSNSRSDLLYDLSRINLR